jgi:hypothetical protein
MPGCKGNGSPVHSQLPVAVNGLRYWFEPGGHGEPRLLPDGLGCR